MEISRRFRRLVMLALAVGLGCSGEVALAQEQADMAKELKEMPVLTGDRWQMMSQDSKIAFVWGIGHVVTIEEGVIQRHPELRRKGFVAKLAEGLSGVPMNTIIYDVDTYYQRHPDDLDLPVMRVIWSQLVKPKLKAGIADQPLGKQEPEKEE